MAVHNPDAFVVVVDTGQYAGNFEREMVAFMTGQVGECQVGQAEAADAREDLQNLDWLDSHTVQVADDNQCERPASIWRTPAHLLPEGARPYEYNSVAYFVDEAPPRAVLDELIQRAKDFCAEHGIVFLGTRLLKAEYREVVVREVCGHVEVEASAQA